MTPTPAQRLAGAAFGLQVFVTGLLGHCMFVLPLGAVIRFGPAWGLRAARALIDRAIGSWLAWNAAWCEVVCGVSFVRRGDAAGGFRGARANECALVMCNHRTRLDWQWLYPWTVATGRAHNFKAVLKQGIARLPGAGWAMQVGGLVFLRRRWLEDRGTLDAQLGYYGRSGYPLWLLFFPEGTDLSDENLERSRRYAAEHSLPVWHQVLHPRTTGLVHTVRALGPALDAVYDTTVAYAGPVCQSEKMLVGGVFPHAVHVHARRYDAAPLRAMDDEALAAWVRGRFAEKERWLTEFYASPRASAPRPPRRPTAALVRDYGTAVVLWTALVAGTLWFLPVLWPWLVAACAFSHWHTRHGEAWGMIESRRATAMGVTYGGAREKSE